MTTIASRKAKARRLQNSVAKDLRDRMPGIVEKDIIPATMGETGEDIKMSPLAQNKWPLGKIECGNQEKLNIWAKMEQTLSRDRKGLLVFARNRSKRYACLRWAVLLDLLFPMENENVEAGDEGNREKDRSESRKDGGSRQVRVYQNGRGLNRNFKRK